MIKMTFAEIKKKWLSTLNNGQQLSYARKIKKGEIEGFKYDEIEKVYFVEENANINIVTEKTHTEKTLTEDKEENPTSQKNGAKTFLYAGILFGTVLVLAGIYGNLKSKGKDVGK